MVLVNIDIRDGGGGGCRRGTVPPPPKKKKKIANVKIRAKIWRNWANIFVACLSKYIDRNFRSLHVPPQKKYADTGIEDRTFLAHKKTEQVPYAYAGKGGEKKRWWGIYLFSIDTKISKWVDCNQDVSYIGLQCKWHHKNKKKMNSTNIWKLSQFSQYHVLLMHLKYNSYGSDKVTVQVKRNASTKWAI